MIFYFEGDDYFQAIRETLVKATASIEIELYYFASDNIGSAFADLLMQKAAEKVKVRLIYDAVGCRETHVDFLQKLEESGVEIKAYHPFLPFGRNYARRDHRKMILVDGEIAFLGGFNLSDEYSEFISGKTAWRDTGVQIKDHELVMALEDLFQDSWRGRILKVSDFIRKRPKRPNWSLASAHVVPNYGWQHKSLIRQEYLSAIVHAKKKVWLTNPYFIPDRGIRRALRRAAKRGLDVRLLTAGVTDVHIVRWAGHATYASLLRAGVRIFEYQERFLHAKTAVVDDDWYTVGTSNLDHLSFFRNLEINLVGREHTYAHALSEQFQKDLERSLEVKLETWSQRSWWIRLREKIFFLMRSWL